MFLNSIKLNNFRNYALLEHTFGKRKTLFVGKNAQGKTNLLEAVYYLSALSSNRIKKDSELIKFKEESCIIQAQCTKNDTDVSLEVVINPPKNKVLKVNGLKKNKSQDFLRVLKVVNFSSADLMLMRGDPSNRRKWLDLAICQVYGAYYDKLQKYNKIRLQKSNFLGQNYNDDGLLDAFNTQMSIAAANIVFLRIKFLSELQKIASQKHKTVSEDEELTFYYESEVPKECNVKELSEFIYDKLCQVKNDEIRRAQCLFGPHRDDIPFFINGIDARKFASQGQQRTLVLALKLAELDIIKEKVAEVPILLLDDVLAELDNVRQNYLLKAIENDTQTIITSVDTLAFDKEFLSDVEIVKISAGAIV